MDTEVLDNCAEDGFAAPARDPFRNMTVNDIHLFLSNSKGRKCKTGEPLEALIRNRLINARRLNGIDQIEAAKLLGYQNSSQLSKIESGHAKVPKGIVRRAATVYGVSTDYLLGLSSEPERDPKTAEHMAIVRTLDATISHQNHQLASILLKNAADMVPMEGHLNTVLANAKRCVEAFDTVCRKNRKFQDDVLAGSTLQRAMDEVNTSINNARNFMRRRAAIIDARTEAACDGQSYPLFE
jgi:transcriptional regulator with XRE-family HTH domain